MMKTSAISGMSYRLQASPFGRQVKRHRFWIGLAAGAAIVWASSESLGSLAATGIGAVLLSVLPCALMMGVCMKMMHHGDGASCENANETAPQLPSSPAPSAPADDSPASPTPEMAYSRAALLEKPTAAQTSVSSTNLQG